MHLHLDAWFTGADCASTAVEQLKAAIRRRMLVCNFNMFPSFSENKVPRLQRMVCKIIFVHKLCVSHSLRYDLTLGCATGRACDIAGNSKKLLGNINSTVLVVFFL